MVREFHLRNRYPVDRFLFEDRENGSGLVDFTLAAIVEMLENRAKKIESHATQAMLHGGDCRLYRVHLMLEELGEVVEALMKGNEEELADGLVDLIYVTLGTGVTYDLPLGPCHDSVHCANMDKNARTDDDVRMRNKGAHWRKADLAAVIRKYRREAKGIK
jgi:predicted HAD superfamily Cof-like phosphohydrolase